MYTPEEKQWGMLAHVIPLVMCLLTVGHGWIAALVIYLIYKDKSKFVAYHSLQALYFQGFIVILCAIGGILICALGLGILVLIAAGIIDIIFPILAGIAASNGELYELPVVGRLARNSVGI